MKRTFMKTSILIDAVAADTVSDPDHRDHSIERAGIYANSIDLETLKTWKAPKAVLV